MSRQKDIDALQQALDGMDKLLAVKEGIIHQLYEIAASQVSLLERLKRGEVTRRQADIETQNLQHQEAELRKVMQETEATENELRAILAPLYEPDHGGAT